VFDAPGDRPRCPCHSTSFSPTGQLLAHQLPVAPTPLQVREVNGTIEVLGPVEPPKPA
jgi:cytochrome b6-f complex iron-sulfur subunit